MPRGPGPDDNLQLGERVRSVVDFGEAIARLQAGRGGLVRTGTVLLSTAFNDGRQEFFQNAILSGSGAAVALDNTRAQFGAASLKLTHGNIAGNQTGIRREDPVSPATKFGVDVSCILDETGPAMIFFIQASIADGVANQHAYQWRFTYTVAPSLEVAYLNSGGTFTVFQTIPRFLPTQWSNIKVVADNTVPGAPKYSRIYINGRLYDMSGIAARNFAATDLFPYHQTNLIIQATQAANKSLWLGSVIITTDES